MYLTPCPRLQILCYVAYRTKWYEGKYQTHNFPNVCTACVQWSPIFKLRDRRLRWLVYALHPTKGRTVRNKETNEIPKRNFNKYTSFRSPVSERPAKWHLQTSRLKFRWLGTRLGRVFRENGERRRFVYSWGFPLSYSGLNTTSCLLVNNYPADIRKACHVGNSPGDRDIHHWLTTMWRDGRLHGQGVGRICLFIMPLRQIYYDFLKFHTHKGFIRIQP